MDGIVHEYVVLHLHVIVDDVIVVSCGLSQLFLKNIFIGLLDYEKLID